MSYQLSIGNEPAPRVAPFKEQLLKWIGNKQRFAHEIAAFFPNEFGVYREPFLGSGGVLGTLAPKAAIGADSFAPLIEIWRMLREEPECLKDCYDNRWHEFRRGNKVEQYERLKARYNSDPNGPDLLFLSRACYGGVVRFRQFDGHMSTPCGAHDPISPAAFAKRVDEWHLRTVGTTFVCQEFEASMAVAEPGDLIYCDPPYSCSQSILYGAQSFELADLFRAIADCKKRGVYVALSIDGTKRSGELVCDVPMPKGLFQREVLVNCGRSMLRRFQMNGRTLENEVVSDRLLLTY